MVRKSGWRWLRIVAAGSIAVAACGVAAMSLGPRASAVAVAQPAAGAGKSIAVGPVSRLPVPRFVSLKSDQVNVRRGPAREQQVDWIYRRAGLPVEVTAEWENWRRIRDADGAEGWVYHSLLSGRRTALIAPWSDKETLPLRNRPDADAAIVARLQPKVQSTVSRCRAGWCQIRGDRFDGWIEQDRLWGVYPNEKVD